MRFGEEITMRSHDYFKKLSETPATEKKVDPTLLDAKIQKYLASGKTVTEVPRGVSGAVLSPMGICRNTLTKTGKKR